MKRRRRGYTLVEVMLFLAITGLLFVGIALGVQNSMFQQRYNDSVQGFADFLRNVYSQTSNVQNSTSGGRSEMAFYGKLVVFGESKTLDGADNNDGEIYSYDVVGAAEGSLSGNTLEDLKSLGATIWNDGGFAGNVEAYKPRWQARIQGTDNNGKDFEGALLVVRNPQSGTVFTFKTGEKLEINNGPEDFKLINYLGENSKFEYEQVDFCVNPDGEQVSDTRRDIRVLEGARNASGVEVIGADATGETGNKCREGS